jgi:hypothetical protein
MIKNIFVPYIRLNYQFIILVYLKAIKQELLIDWLNPEFMKIILSVLRRFCFRFNRLITPTTKFTLLPVKPMILVIERQGPIEERI